MISRDEWKQQHQTFESDWWGDCCNTYMEESKQRVYARHMGVPLLEEKFGGKPWPIYDTRDKTVIDIGGGPVSMLLKAPRRRGNTVVDPCPYPEWVYHRYGTHGIAVVVTPAEDFFASEWYYPAIELWAYNVLQHVIDPEKIARGAAATGGNIRAWEWVNFAPEPGHPHTLRAEELNQWYGKKGEIKQLTDSECNLMGSVSAREFWCLGG